MRTGRDQVLEHVQVKSASARRLLRLQPEVEAAGAAGRGEGALQLQPVPPIHARDARRAEQRALKPQRHARALIVEARTAGFRQVLGFPGMGSAAIEPPAHQCIQAASNRHPVQAPDRTHITGC